MNFAAYKKTINISLFPSQFHVINFPPELFKLKMKLYYINQHLAPHLFLLS